MSSPRWAPCAGWGPLPALKAAVGLQRLPHLCLSLLTPHLPRGAQKLALNSTSGRPPPCPGCPDSDAPRYNSHTCPWTPPTNWLHLSLPWRQEKAISWARPRPGGTPGSSPPKPHIHPWSVPAGPCCLNIPHLSEPKRAGKIVRGGRWDEAPLPRSAARCPCLPTARLLSGAPGRLPPLLATSPPGGLLRAPLWPPVPPLPPGLQGLRERLGPAAPPPHSSCLPQGRGGSCHGLGLNPPLPPHPLSSSHTGLLAVSPIKKACSSLRAFAPAVSATIMTLLPGAYKPCPRAFLRPVFECHLLEFQAFPD